MADIKQNIPESPDRVGKKEIRETFEVPVPEKARVLEAPERNAEGNELALKESDHQKARREIEAIDAGEGLKTQIRSSANDLKSLDDKKKIRNLMELVKSKGLIFAVNVAKKLDDPYVLDMFHDELVKNGYYKEFLK